MCFFGGLSLSGVGQVVSESYLVAEVWNAACVYGLILAVYCNVQWLDVCESTCVVPPSQTRRNASGSSWCGRQQQEQTELLLYEPTRFMVFLFVLPCRASPVSLAFPGSSS